MDNTTMKNSSTKMENSKQISLLCEYMKKPVGLTMEAPRFTWSVADNSLKIKEYRILVTDCVESDCIWDSGWIREENAYRTSFGGRKLESGVTYQWKVILRAASGENQQLQELESEKASFTMGLMEPDAWIAPWIGGIKIDGNSYLYRKEWKNKGLVKRAAAFVATPCYYVLTINGKKADDTVLNNVFADYEKSLYYRTYDITDLISEKENAVGIMTGLGWHSLREAEDGIGWGDSLFSMQIRLEYEDGTIEWVVSDTNGWTYSNKGPIRYNSIYNGEIYDARMEIKGWDCPAFNDSEFSKAVEREAPKGQLKSQILEPIRVVRNMEPVQIIDVGDGSYTLDFGKNSAGYVRIKMAGNAGDSISIKPAELMNKDGSVNPISLRNAHPVDTYIFKGEGIEEYEPHFTYHGFRYAQIYGLHNTSKSSMFTGCFVRSDVDRIGQFSCNDAIVQQFYDMVCQTEECNVHGVPTDCPQRDERLGWLNDMTVRNEGALYNYKHYQLYAKWMRDIKDAQGEVTGAITDTAPFMRYGFRPADPVSGSFLMIPWNLYVHYGDDRIIRENYDANAKWVEYLKRNSDGLIVRFSSMGDWAAPIGGTDHSSTGGGALSVITPQLLMSTGFFYHDCTLMEKMADVLGKEEDVVYYHSLAQSIKNAFNKEYYNEEKGYYATGSQASCVLPLYFGMVEESQAKRVLDYLVKDIEEVHGGHLSTGNICTRYAMEVLFMYGKEDLAWKLLSQTSYPSWGYMIERGATTVWERWEDVTENEELAAMASLNHPMNGGAVICLHKYLAGIRPDESMPGFEHIIMKPLIPEKAEHASAQIQTIRGEVSSQWKKENGKLTWKVSIPVGCSASLYLPVKGQERIEEVGSGEHCFTI